MIIPDAIEPVIAYKALVVLPSGLLRSPSKYFLWPMRERAAASCFRRQVTGHQIVGPSCRCGLYALDISQRQRLAMYFGHRHVMVRLALWGKTAMGTSGVRAEFAYPQEIVAWTCGDRAARLAAERYGMGIVMHNLGQGWCFVRHEEIEEGF